MGTKKPLSQKSEGIRLGVSGTIYADSSAWSEYWTDTQWSHADCMAAQREGWDVFASKERGMEIQRVDYPMDGGPPKFSGDWVACQFVSERVGHSILHTKAWWLTEAKR